MLLGVCGYGYSGSGAVLDLLSEYNSVKTVMKEEFAIAYLPDGLEALDYAINSGYTRYMTSDIAMLRFRDMVCSTMINRDIKRLWKRSELCALVDNYLSKISDVEWKGYWGYDSYLASPLMRTIVWRVFRRINAAFESNGKPAPIKVGYRTMRVSVNKCDFIEETQAFTEALLSRSIGDEHVSVINQPFSVNDPFGSIKYFNNAKAIIVDRDPVDLYIATKSLNQSQNSWIPTSNVSDYVCYYKQIRRKRNANDINDNNVLYLRFEDLIYKYEATRMEIERFLEIENTQLCKQSFDRNKSIVNTNLIIDYPEYRDEAAIIRDELNEYVYMFPYGRPANEGRGF